MVAYYNDSDPFCCAWLRNLIAGGFIPGGYVDERDIADIEPGDLRGFRQCHFFAGIGGWAYALQLAGWDPDRPVWTGSCPCQPFSSAGRQGGALDDRHLWPRWLRLVGECRPDAILGEQVEGAVGFGWVDRVFRDLEAEGYACGAAVLGAHSVGAPHIRQRLFWVADADQQRQREAGRAGTGEWPGGDGSYGSTLADADEAGSDRQRLEGLSSDGDAPHRHDADRRGEAGGLAAAYHAYGELGARGEVRKLGDTRRTGLEGLQRSGDMELRRGAEPAGSIGTAGFWSDAVWLPCLDGKSRRVVASLQPLAHAGECICSLRLGQLCACEERPSRIGMLRGSGNAIVPPAAALFIEAVMEVRP